MTTDLDESDDGAGVAPGTSRRQVPAAALLVPTLVAVAALIVSIVALAGADSTSPNSASGGPTSTAPDPRAGWTAFDPDAYLPGWTAFYEPPMNAHYYPVEYMKDDDGWVHIHGVVISDNAPAYQPIARGVGPWASDIVVLPEGFRPACTVPVVSIIGDLAGVDTKEGWIIVRRDGTIFMSRYGDAPLVDGQPVIQNTALMNLSFQADSRKCPTDDY